MRGNKLSLNFGLVNIGIKYAPLAESTSAISAKTLCPEHQVPVNQGEWVCGKGTANEHSVSRDEVIKGYPHPENPKQLVVVDPSVIEEFAEERTGVASIERIVDFSTIDPVFLDKSYIVFPGDGGTPAEQAFDLFATVLRTEGKAAVTTAVISKQTRTLVFRWSEQFDCLIAHVCLFSSKIRTADIQSVTAVAAKRPEPPKEAIELAKQILGSLEGEFDASEAIDTYTPMVQDAIRQAAGGKVAAPAPAKEKVAAPASDLMAVLSASVEAAKKPTTKKAAPAAKRSTKTTKV